MAFNRLITSVLDDAPFTVYGDGLQTRDFTFVGDAVQGTLQAGLAGVPGTAYNLGGGGRHTMQDVFDALSEIAQRRPRLTYASSQRGDARDTSADTRRAAADLGFAPSHSFRAGLEAQYHWHRNLPAPRGSVAGRGNSSGCTDA
jgi:nucleoside-diphosphate-sugar epimerase